MARTEAIRIRLTTEEKTSAFKACKRLGFVTLSDLIREVLRRASRKEKITVDTVLPQ